MMEQMDRPLTRTEFERRLYIMRESCMQGKFKIAKGCNRLLDSLVRIRTLPNKRIDLLTIDEAARLNANMMVNNSFIDRSESDV